MPKRPVAGSRPTPCSLDTLLGASIKTKWNFICFLRYTLHLDFITFHPSTASAPLSLCTTLPFRDDKIYQWNSIWHVKCKTSDSTRKAIKSRHFFLCLFFLHFFSSSRSSWISIRKMKRHSRSAHLFLLTLLGVSQGRGHGVMQRFFIRLRFHVLIHFLFLSFFYGFFSLPKKNVFLGEKVVSLKIGILGIWLFALCFLFSNGRPPAEHSAIGG